MNFHELFVKFVKIHVIRSSTCHKGIGITMCYAACINNEKMKRFYLILGVKLLLSNAVGAQYITGARRDTAHFKTDEAKERLNRRLGRSKSLSAGEILPSAVSLRKWCPTVGKQCNSSCWAWATGHAAMTIRRAQKWNITDRERIDALAFSASYIFNKVSPNCDAVSFSSVEKVLERGVCPVHVFPNDRICNTKPSEKDDLEAERFKVALIEFVFVTEDSKDKKLLHLKQTLNHNLPIVIQVRSVPSLFRPENGIWKYSFNEPDTTDFQHALCLIGYDDRNKRFELMNSWDTTWGDKGFVYIDYEALLENALQRDGLLQAAYKLDIADPEMSPLKGEVILERLVDATNCRNQRFERILVKNNNNIYNTVRPYFTRQDKIRLLFPETNIKQYVYFFGQDAGTGVWKRYEDILLQSPSTLLPQNNELLNFTEAGTEIVCCLFAAQPIKDFERQLDALPKQKVAIANLFNTLKTQFPDITTELEWDKMAFRNGRMALMTVVLEIKE